MPVARLRFSRSSLTSRQEEVLRLVERRLTNAQIATELGISLDGAKKHISEILARLDVESREEAVVVWKGMQRERRTSNLLRVAWMAALGAGAAGLAAVAIAVVVARSGDGSNQANNQSGAVATQFGVVETQTAPAASPTQPISLSELQCDRDSVTLRAEITHIADSNGKGNPGKDIQVWASGGPTEGCILRRELQPRIIWANNRLPQRITPSGTFDLFEPVTIPVETYLIQSQPIAVIHWENSCSVDDAVLYLGFMGEEHTAIPIRTADCTNPGSTDTRLFGEPVTRNTIPSTSAADIIAIPPGFTAAPADLLARGGSVRVATTLDAPDGGDCADAVPYMISALALSKPSGKTTDCVLGQRGRLTFVQADGDQQLYLLSVELLVPAEYGLPELRSATCKDIEQWMVYGGADPASAKWLTVCQARAGVGLPEEGDVIWVRVLPEYVPVVGEAIRPCWQMTAYLPMFAGEARIEPVMCRFPE